MARNEIYRDAGANQLNDAHAAAGEVQLDEVQVTVQQALQELRQIASGMSLPQLHDLSLAEVVSRPARAHERKTGTRVELNLNNIPEQAPLAFKITVYRLIQEALNNSYRHAGGVGQTLHVESKGQDLMIEVTDRGPGFDVNRWKTSEDHLGLLGMRERIESLGGRFIIESKIGVGTKITAHLLVNAEGINE